jgi:hypothetical protein
MDIHDTLQSERFANLCVSAATTQRPIFWQPKLPRSQLSGAMRKSRQPRCTAAFAQIGATKTAKPLDVGWNFGRAIFRSRPAARREGSHTCPAWHEVKQGVPAA